MISGILHQGSGLGDQLFRYITTRVIADEKGVDFGMINPEGFKGKDFMKLDMGKPVPLKYTIEQPSGRAYFDVDNFNYWEEKNIIENGVDIRSYDPEINFITDNTIIDGSFEDDKYWGHRLYDISHWLSVEPLKMPEDICVIGFRGGEYAGIPELFLPTSYYEEAMAEMLKLDYNMKFMCVTDDPETARRVLPQEVSISHEIGLDWRKTRFAPHLIIPNSAFYVLPALLNRRARKVIAPRGWARHNLNNGTWGRPASYYKRFTYI